MSDTDGQPTAADIQDPLPESNWRWRRFFTFAAVVGIFVLLIMLALFANRIIGNVTDRLDNMDAINVVAIAKQALTTIETMFRLMFWALIVVVTYYMIAPSAEQITKMLQTAGLLKAGVQLASRTVQTEDRKETAATVGQPPQPVVPPMTDEMAPASPISGPSGVETTREAVQVAPEPEIAPMGLPDDMPAISVPDKAN